MQTNIPNVLSQLMYEWDEDEDGNAIKGKQLRTEAEAMALINKHRDLYEDGVRMGSFAYYTANKIANAG